MRNEFTYDDNGVPIITEEGIETFAAKVCHWFDDGISTTPSSVDILKIYTKLVENKKLCFLYKDLNTPKQEKRILGKFCYGSPPRIILDQSHENYDSSMRVRFTLAHELGHYVLHRHRKIKNTEVLIDTEDDLPRHYITPKTKRKWEEWQANYFAGALLIPPVSLEKKLKEIHKEEGIRRNIGKIYLDNSESNKKTFWTALARLALFYEVSQACMEIRLKQRGLLIDKRFTSDEITLSCSIKDFFVTMK